MARIPYFDLDKATPTFRDMVATRPQLNIYRMVGHGGPVGEGFFTLGNAILRQSELPPQLRELAILRVGALCGSAYEIFHHRQVATHAGVAIEKIEAVLQNTQSDVTPGVFSTNELVVVNYCDALVRQIKASVETFDAVSAMLTHQQHMELTMTIGFYMMVCRVLENFEVDIEDPPIQF
jgi:alkylhydroperoxidase family enzyme